MRPTAIIYVPTDTPASMASSVQRVAGVPLIVRAIMNCNNSGIKRCILLIAPSQRQKIEKFLKKYRPERLPEVVFINYDEPYGISPEIVLEILGFGEKQYVFLNSNLLVEPSTIKRLLSLPTNNRQTVLVKRGVINIPIILASAYIMQSLSEFTVNKPRSIESCLNRIVELSEHKELFLDQKDNFFLVSRSQDRRVAEKFLAEAIRHNTNTPVAKVLNKRFSLPISIILSRLWISPHAITMVNIFIGLLCGVFLGGGKYEDMLIGAILFKIASVADGCDGEVAKLTFRSSKFGQYIDTISDTLALASFLVGMSIGVFKELGKQPVWPLVVGLWTIIAVALVILIMANYLKHNTDSASLATFDYDYLRRIEQRKSIFTMFISTMKHFVKKDSYALLSLIFAIFGWLKFWLCITAFGATVALITLIVLQPKKSEISASVVEKEKVTKCTN